MSNETICALATAPGGAIGIIRVSGPQSIEVLSRVFTKDVSSAQPNTIHYGHIKDGSEIIDEVMVSLFRARPIPGNLRKEHSSTARWTSHRPKP